MTTGVARRLLVAAGQAATSTQDLPFGVRELIDSAEEILVVTPALATRFEWLASATDKAHKQADQRLSEILGHLDTNWEGQRAARSVLTIPCLLSRTR